MATIAVYEWLAGDGTGLGCGTKVELEYWQSEGVIDADASLGRTIAHEPASEDARRQLAWAA